MKKNTLKKGIILSLMTALMVILSRFVSIPFSDNLRISLECIPVILSGLWFGPVAGLVVGALGDIIGSILFPFGVYFFPLTIGPMLLGLVCGLGSGILHIRDTGNPVHIALIIIVAELINSFLYGTLALTWYYSIILQKNVTFWILFVARAPAKTVTLVVDIALSIILHKTLYRNVIHKEIKNDGY